MNLSSIQLVYVFVMDFLKFLTECTCIGHQERKSQDDGKTEMSKYFISKLMHWFLFPDRLHMRIQLLSPS